MQNKWYVLAVTGVALALAVLMMPWRDTGDSMTGTENTNPVAFKRGPEPVPGRRVITAEKRLERPSAVLGPNPIAARLVAERNTPEAMTAARMSAPWTIVRRELILSGNEEAKKFGEGLAPLVVDLRNLRRTPKEHDFSELMGRHRATMAELKTHEDWVDNDVIQQQIARLDEVLTAYDNGEVEMAQPSLPIAPAVAPTTAPTTVKE